MMTNKFVFRSLHGDFNEMNILVVPGMNTTKNERQYFFTNPSFHVNY